VDMLYFQMNMFSQFPLGFPPLVSEAAVMGCGTGFYRPVVLPVTQATLSKH